ncbi:MAG: hydroxylamine reductase [Treponema sp.]|jgi:hydroxylamine reductase|nr:hydroxylamine reductase [Treponema sp.]
MEKMFCFQCEQTAGGKGCSGRVGVCGKQEGTAQLQDRLTGELILLGQLALGKRPSVDTDRLVMEGLFSTLSNVNFDDPFIEKLILRIRQERIGCFAESTQREGFDLSRIWQAQEDIRSLKSLLLFGIRGIGAYGYHAWVLGYRDDEISAFLYKALDALGKEDCPIETLLSLVMETGRINLKSMALLDRANTERFGDPQPRTVSLTVEKGPFIVISGHDLGNLKLLLEQSAGQGVHIYTHGEMLPAHAYPALNTYPHLKGNFGTAWQNQQQEFEGIPGAVLFTSNCLMPVKDSYRDRVFTTAATAYPGVIHIDEAKNFTPLIARALKLGGYTADRLMRGMNRGTEVHTGFARHSLLSSADPLIAGIKAGTIRHLFLVGGCDGANPGRSYYRDFVKQTPEDTLILTLGCGKYRFNDLDLGEIGGLPRILDLGQCNDAYAAITIALALSEAFGCSVNELPLSLVLSWYEQKAVSILLTLLSLGIKNMFLGPSLPAFVSSQILHYLVEQFNLRLISTPTVDMATMLKSSRG